jgi:hypothetical protein
VWLTTTMSWFSWHSATDTINSDLPHGTYPEDPVAACSSPTDLSVPAYLSLIDAGLGPSSASVVVHLAAALLLAHALVVGMQCMSGWLMLGVHRGKHLAMNRPIVVVGSVLLFIVLGGGVCMDWTFLNDAVPARWTVATARYGAQWVLATTEYGARWTHATAGYSMQWTAATAHYGVQWAAATTQYGTGWTSATMDYGRRWAAAVVASHVTPPGNDTPGHRPS